MNNTDLKLKLVADATGTAGDDDGFHRSRFPIQVESPLARHRSTGLRSPPRLMLRHGHVSPITLPYSTSTVGFVNSALRCRYCQAAVSPVYSEDEHNESRSGLRLPDLITDERGIAKPGTAKSAWLKDTDPTPGSFGQSDDLSPE